MFNFDPNNKSREAILKNLEGARCENPILYSWLTPFSPQL
jgi:hypothetical protein